MNNFLELKTAGNFLTYLSDKVGILLQFFVFLLFSFNDVSEISI